MRIYPIADAVNGVLGGEFSKEWFANLSKDPAMDWNQQQIMKQRRER